MFANRSFSQKILIAAAAVVIGAFALFALYNDSLQRKSIGDSLDNYLQDMGLLTATNIESWLSGRALLISAAAEALAADASAEAVTRLIEQPVMTKTFDYIYMGGEDGSMAMRPKDELPADYDPRQRPWFKAALAASGITITDPYVDANTNALIVTLAAPVPGKGVVGGDLSLKALVETINALDFNGTGYAFLVSEDGTILAHPDSKLAMKTLAELFPQATPELTAALTEVEVDGSTRLLTFTPVKNLPGVKWYVGLSIDKAKAFAMLDEFRWSALVAALIAVAGIIGLLGMLIGVLLKPMRVLGHTMDDIAAGEGDLTRRLQIDSQDEFGRLAGAFNRFVERIHASISEVASAARAVNDVSLQVMSASNSSMQNSDEQVSRTNSVAAAINQLGAAAQEIAQNAASASHQATDARRLAESGRQVVEQTIDALGELTSKVRASCGNIEALNSKTANIGQILEVIKSISEQTNLLALNAAIEAARAGDAGRGFAVVADEVRNLAHRTQESAQEIHSMIDELQSGAQSAVGTMVESQRYSEDSVGIANRAGEQLGSVTERIGEIDGMNQSVAAATEEQTAVIESLNMDINEINTLNQQGLINLHTTQDACRELDIQASRLKQLVDSFRI